MNDSEGATWVLRATSGPANGIAVPLVDWWYRRKQKSPAPAAKAAL